MSFEVLILSDVRFVCEGLSEVLARNKEFSVVGIAVNVEQACGFAKSTQPLIILVDTALPQGLQAVWTLHECASSAKIVAFSLAEIESEVIAWAQAGICGYIPRNTPLSGLVGMLRDIVRGEQVCQTRIASGLLRWISRSAPRLESREPSGGQASLTLREREVAHLIGTGLSNKEIAGRLGISLATTKCHVHSILGKLGVARRVLAVRRLRERAETATSVLSGSRVRLLTSDP
jgi:DNA-binding NarL/FixJ family response regulator